MTCCAPPWFGGEALGGSASAGLVYKSVALPPTETTIMKLRTMGRRGRGGALKILAWAAIIIYSVLLASYQVIPGRLPGTIPEFRIIKSKERAK